MSVLKDVPTCSKSLRDYVTEESQLAQQILLCIKPLDELLKCHICFEYFNTCVITKCCHSFCSLCIRKYMSYKAQCPQCFQEATEPELRCNRQIDEVLLIYSQLKELLQPFHESLNFSNSSPCKHLPQSQLSQNHLENIPTSTKSSSYTVSKSVRPLDTPTKTDSILALETTFKDQDSDKVCCPVCSVYVHAEKINTHLDWCLTMKENPESSENASRRKPLAKVVYHLLSDKEIKKRLKENGLNTAGSRQKLIKRHRSFVLLYNSECDKTNPRPVSEIVKQVEREEIEVRSTERTKLFQTDKKSNPTTIEVENERYLKQNKNQFDSLVEEIFKRRVMSQDKKGDNKNEESELSINTQDSPTNNVLDNSAASPEETSPELFKEIDIHHGRESSEATASDDDVTLLESPHDSPGSSEDFVPHERTSRSRKMLKRKM